MALILDMTRKQLQCEAEEYAKDEIRSTHIKCPCCGLLQRDVGQNRCDRYGCNEPFDREE